jgi:hypothetical protein
MRPEQLTSKPRPPVSPRGRLTNAANWIENTRACPHAVGVRATLAAAVGSVKPGRVRNRTKTEPEQKVKKPADGVQKKTPPARKAPARGRYVDEYAHPAN